MKKVVIELPDEVWERIMVKVESADYKSLELLVQEGITLPEHYGRLIDADAFAKALEDCVKECNYGELLFGPCLNVGDVFQAVIDELRGEAFHKFKYNPTIIPATEEDCALTDCKCNDNGKCTDGLAYKESCYDCYQLAMKEGDAM